MRYGIFSDIHSNLEAFESVLKALKSEKVDAYICAGDIVGYGADPFDCIRLTKELTSKIVCGNHDRASVGLFDVSYFNDYAREAVRWTSGVLGSNEKAYLKGLKLSHEERDLAVVHGSLDEPEKFRYVTDLYSASQTFFLMRKKLLFIGHSHSPVIFTKSGERISFGKPGKLKLDKRASYIVNVGSVGQPRDGDPRACYVVYDSDSANVDTKRIPYDIMKAQAKIVKAGLSPYLAERIGMGW